MNPASATLAADRPGERLDQFLARTHQGQSRSAVAAWIRAGRVSVNGGVAAKTGVKLSPGDRIVIDYPPPRPSHVEPEEGPLEILYQDEALAVLNKPSGLSVHPAGPRRTGTLVNRLLFHFKNHLSSLGGETRPGLVHRLDQETSGVLVVARTDAAHRALAAQFAARTVDKHYLAVVRGQFKVEKVKIEAPIGRHPRDRKKMGVMEGGRAAVTHVRVLAPLGHHSVVLARPLTGRTHQIRVHLAHAGHPVLGDTLYGYRPDAAVRRIVREAMARRRGAYLHAFALAFDHPAQPRRMSFTAPPPEDFRRLLAAFGVDADSLVESLLKTFNNLVKVQTRGEIA
ncbi:RluA family pseudouridine synthase [bacterium]|nr:RluA family pseudouridine synthase [bacterium]